MTLPAERLFCGMTQGVHPQAAGKCSDCACTGTVFAQPASVGSQNMLANAGPTEIALEQMAQKSVSACEGAFKRNLQRVLAT